MKKLRLIQERKTDSVSDNDLRGLGHTSILKDFTPQPFLVASSIKVHLSKKELLDLSLESIDFKGALLLKIASEESFKLKYINSFFAMALIFNKNQNGKYLLCETDELQIAMRLAITENKSYELSIDGQFESLKASDKSFTISEQARLNLIQAGLLEKEFQDKLDLTSKDLINAIKRIQNKFVDHNIKKINKAV